jgi:hypothetical protein
MSEPILNVCLFLLYFLPSFAARHKANFYGILLLNIFLGWTFVGWLIALAWALGAKQEVPRSPEPKKDQADRVLESVGHFCFRYFSYLDRAFVMLLIFSFVVKNV